MSAPSARPLRGTALLLVLYLVAVASPTASAGDVNFGSALIVGIGGAYAGAPENAGTLWFNPAMADSGAPGAVSLAYRRLWELSDLAEVNAAIRRNLGGRVTIGAGFNRFGKAGLFQEYDALVAVSYRFAPKWSAGIGLHYLRTEFGDNEVAAAGAFLDAGLTVSPSPVVRAGLAIRRIPIDGLYQGETDDPGMLYEISAAWHAPSELTIAGIWTHESDGDNRFGIGQRMPLGAVAEFLAGLRFDPVRYNLGGQIHHGGGALQYVYQSHSDLGGTHTLGLAWEW